MTQGMLEKIVHGLSTRNYSHGLESVGHAVNGKSISKSSVSRKFIQETAEALSSLLSRDLHEERFLALMIDGIGMTDHMVIVALGINQDGEKKILGLWEGATENSSVCKALLMDLVDRGLYTDDGILVGIDGSKALRSAVRSVLGKHAIIQRCQAQKMRNVLDHLPRKETEWVERKIKEAWKQTDADKASCALNRLANQLQTPHPGAASSLREGLEETLTVIRLGVPPLLQATLRTTNPIESAFKTAREVSHNVKNWKNGQQVLRYAAVGMMKAESCFRRIKGFRQLPILKEALYVHIHSVKIDNPSITA